MAYNLCKGARTTRSELCSFLTLISYLGMCDCALPAGLSPCLSISEDVGLEFVARLSPLSPRLLQFLGTSAVSPLVGFLLSLQDSGFVFLASQCVCQMCTSCIHAKLCVAILRVQLTVCCACHRHTVRTDGFIHLG